MHFSTEATIALVALLVACPPSLLVVWNIYRRRTYAPAVGPTLPRRSTPVKKYDHHPPIYQVTKWTTATSTRIESVLVVDEPFGKHLASVRSRQDVAKTDSIRCPPAPFYMNTLVLGQ